MYLVLVKQKKEAKDNLREVLCLYFEYSKFDAIKRLDRLVLMQTDLTEVEF
jgi:hypothetical protein